VAAVLQRRRRLYARPDPILRVETAGEAGNADFAKQRRRRRADEVLQYDVHRRPAAFDGGGNDVLIGADAVFCEDRRHNVDEILVAVVEGENQRRLCGGREILQFRECDDAEPPLQPADQFVEQRRLHRFVGASLRVVDAMQVDDRQRLVVPQPPVPPRQHGGRSEQLEGCVSEGS
jgi:hypothetical protein